MKGSLVLVPTPIDDEGELNPNIVSRLDAAWKNNDLIVVEEHKAARRRWISWGLDREAIDSFILYNEHKRDNSKIDNLIGQIKRGKTVYLMSDGGMPAFCDPGQKLVDRCHREEIKVTSLEFSNSVTLAVSLSGFNHDQFIFSGFLPRKPDERRDYFKKISVEKNMVVIMDTPYRLKKVLNELVQFLPNREVFIGCDLNASNELCLRGKPVKITRFLGESKREFVLVLAPL